MYEGQTDPERVHGGSCNDCDVASVHEVEGSFCGGAQLYQCGVWMFLLCDCGATDFPDMFKKTCQRVGCPIVQSRISLPKIYVKVHQWNIEAHLWFEQNCATLDFIEN